MSRLVSSVVPALILLAALGGCQDQALDPLGGSHPDGKPAFLGDPPGGEAPDCDDCQPTDIWCETWELACHLKEWTEVSNNLSRISTDRYSGITSGKHNFRVSSNATRKIFANSYQTIAVEFAVKFSPNFFPTGTSPGGKHFWRLKSHQPLETFELDNDFRHEGVTPFWRFLLFTPQTDGSPRYEWPDNAHASDRLLLDITPYRTNWGKFKVVITLNTPNVANGSFYLYEWVGGQWEVRKSLVNVDMLGLHPDPAFTSFKTFHWTNYDQPFQQEDEAYWLTDDLKIYL